MKAKTRKIHWLALFLTMVMSTGMLAILSAAPQIGFAGPAIAALASRSVESPILGNWVTFQDNSVDNLAPAIAFNSERNEYLVVWEDHNASEIAIYGQRVDSEGWLQGGTITIAYTSAITKTQPAVAYSPDYDKYLVVFSYDWKPSSPPYTDYQIAGQPVNGNGTITESLIGIAGITLKHERRPAVTYNTAYKEFLVTWDVEQGAGGWHDIWAQRINASNWSFEPGPVCIDTGDGLHRYQPDVAYNSVRNNYFIAYTKGSSLPDGDIYGKVLDAGLTDTLSVPELEIVMNWNLQGDVSLAAGKDEYLAIWKDGPSASWRTIYARRITGTGTLPSAGFLVAEHTNDVCADPDVTYGQGLGYLATWYWSSPTATDTYGRYIQPGKDEPAGDEFVIDDDTGAQINPAVACSLIGDCFYVEADHYGSSNYDIYGRTIWFHHVFLPVMRRSN